MGENARAISHVWAEARGQRISCENQFSPSFMWVPGLELRLSALGTGLLQGLSYRLWVHSYYRMAFVPVSSRVIGVKAVDWKYSLKLLLFNNNWKWHRSLNPMSSRLNFSSAVFKNTRGLHIIDRKQNVIWGEVRTRKSRGNRHCSTLFITKILYLWTFCSNMQ